MSPPQRISANAISALKDALTDVFWFKKDLYSYAKAAIKGENARADRAALDVFASKVDRKAENTLGLFVAISGFEPTAAEIHSGRHSPLILMDGADLYAVLDGRIDLRELLRRKRRHAAREHPFDRDRSSQRLLSGVPLTLYQPLALAP